MTYRTVTGYPFDGYDGSDESFEALQSYWDDVDQVHREWRKHSASLEEPVTTFKPGDRVWIWENGEIAYKPYTIITLYTDRTETRDLVIENKSAIVVGDDSDYERSVNVKDLEPAKDADCPYTFAHTRTFCGYENCRRS